MISGFVGTFFSARCLWSRRLKAASDCIGMIARQTGARGDSIPCPLRLAVSHPVDRVARARGEMPPSDPAIDSSAVANQAADLVACAARLVKALKRHLPNSLELTSSDAARYSRYSTASCVLVRPRLSPRTSSSCDPAPIVA